MVERPQPISPPSSPRAPVGGEGPASPRPRSPRSAVDTLLIALLLGLSLALLLYAPHHWRYTPDSGVYVGSAVSLVQEGRYWFNGHPNLLYYPGFSLTLAPVIALGGLNFHILHLLSAVWAVLALWLTRAYFPSSRYGWAGAFAPFLLFASEPYLEQAFHVLSDGLFLVVSLGALWLYRRYDETRHPRYLAASVALVAFAPLLRFHGLFLWLGLAVALSARELRKPTPSLIAVLRAASLSLLMLLPFALWTLRNYRLHTPDTFNMANAYFFKLSGLALYAPSLARVEWIDAEWKYGAYSLLYGVQDLLRSLVDTVALDAVPPEGQVLAVALVVGFGGYWWFRAATVAERVYVIASGLFLLYTYLKSRSLYTVPRYWLPLLPFICVAGVLAAEKALAAIPTRARRAVSIALLALVVAVVAPRAGRDFGYAASAATEKHWLGKSKLLDGVAQYFEDNVPSDATVATTDWGVTPMTVRRSSYQVLNDPDHRLTIKRMLDYSTDYLVILDQLAAFSPHARALVAERPDAFTQLWESCTDEGNPCASVYRIDRDALRSPPPAEPAS